MSGGGLPYASATDLRSLVNQGREVMVVVDRHSRVVFANPAAEVLFGQPLHELLGRHLPFEASEEEALVERPDGTMALVRLRQDAMVWEGNSATVYYLSEPVDRDFSDVEELEHKVRRSEERILEYEGLAGELKASLKRAEERAARDEAELKELKEEMVGVRARATELEERLARVSEREAEAQQELDTSRDELVTLRARCREHEERAELRSQRLEEAERALAEARQELDRYRRLAERLEAAAGGSAEGFEQLEEALTLAVRRAQQAETRVEEARVRIVELERGLAEATASRNGSNRETERLAFEDRLTGLPNYNILRQYLDVTTEKIRRGKGSAGLLVIDVDRFRVVNDTLGQKAGDELLRMVARRLETILEGQPHVLGRRGEDEFIVVAYLESSEVDAAQINALARGLGHRILSEMGRPFELSGQTIHVGVSIGISFCPGEAETGQDLFEQAESALYRAKELGRGRIYIYSNELHQLRRRRLTLESELAQAVARGEFLLYYQPVVDLVRGRMAGVEALLRWNHPVHGLLEPAEFLDVAIDSGLIVGIGEWVVQEACGMARNLKRKFVSVNLASRQLIGAGFAKRFMKAVERAGIRPDQMVVEVTEGTGADDPERTIATLGELARWGVGLGIDDFGTGTTSLTDLASLALRFIKIDREFVGQVPNDTQSANLCIAIARLAAGLGVPALAEGVETEEQKTFVRKIGCEMAQGYALGRPAPAGEVLPMLGKKWPV